MPFSQQPRRLRGNPGTVRRRRDKVVRRFTALWLERLESRMLLAVEAISVADPAFYGESSNLGSSTSVSSRGSSISADGQLVAFNSYASDLALGDTNGHSEDVFVRNLANGSTTLVSFNQAGTGSGRGESRNPRISANGQFVAFESTAPDLVANDLNGTYDVFVRDLINGVTQLVTINSTGTGTADSFSNVEGISDDGRYVLFSTTAHNLILGLQDTNNDDDLFVRDRVNNVTHLVSIDLAGQHAGTHRPGGAISGNGRFVTFASNASNLVADINDSNGTTDVFIRDLESRTTSLVSVNSANNASGAGASVLVNTRRGQTITPDGRFVAFLSSATDLVDNFNLNAAEGDIYLRDVQSGTTTLVTVNSQGNGGANFELLSEIAVSPDGKNVAFTSQATNLVAGVGFILFGVNVFVRNVPEGVTRLVTINSDGNSGIGSAQNPSISADGRFVTFKSADGNLVAGDTNGRFDVFVRDLQTNTTLLASRDLAGGGSGNNHSAQYDPPVIRLGLQRQDSLVPTVRRLPHVA